MRASDLQASRARLKSVETIERSVDAEGTWQGFVVDTKPDLQVAKVTGQLYIGSQDVAADERLLVAKGITHVLNVCSESVNSEGLRSMGIVVEHVAMLDSSQMDLLDVFERQCFPFMTQHLSLDHCRLLVHCNAGISRSVAVVIAFLMRSEGLKFEQAFNVVRASRAAAKPNQAFVRQLRAYQTRLEINNRTQGTSQLAVDQLIDKP